MTQTAPEALTLARLVLLLVAAMLLAGCRPTTFINAISPSGHYVKEDGLAYGDHPRQRLDVYRPAEAAADAPVVVFFFGKGWRQGSPSEFEFVAAALTEAGMVVLMPGYRAYPDDAFPAFVEDGAAAVHWAADNVPGVADGTRPLYLAGHSAGAQIAALLALDSRYLAGVMNDPPPLAGFIGLSGPYDFLPLQEGYLLDVFPPGTRPASQPIRFVSAEAPRTLLVHGTGDDRVLAEHSRRLAAGLREQGVPVTLRLYDGVGHARVLAALAPPLQFLADTIEDVVRFVSAGPGGPATLERTTRD